MTGRVLTLATLRVKGASRKQRAKFRRCFGEAVDITPELCAKHAAAFTWSGWADKLLSPKARAACDAAVAAELAAHVAAEAAAIDKYHATLAGNPARDAHLDADMAAWVVYEVTVAKAWAEAYINDKEDHQ